MSVKDRVRELVEPIVEDFDLYLFDLDFVGGRLRVTLDTKEVSKPGEGVTSGVIARVTRQISRELDAEDPVAGGYTLEVTTPGVERRLERAEHYGRSIGETLSVKLFPNAEIDGERRVSGELSSADDQGFVLIGDSGQEISISYQDVAKARTVFDWGPSPKPGSKAHKADKAKQANKAKQAKKPAEAATDAADPKPTKIAKSSQDTAGAQ